MIAVTRELLLQVRERLECDGGEWDSSKGESCRCTYHQVEAALGANPHHEPAPSAEIKRRCNRHADCDAADAARGRPAHHCHSDDCEDCFGC